MPPLARYNIPAPVVGGLLVALLHDRRRALRLDAASTFDTTLQSPLMIAFFTTIGFGASLSLLRVGGPLVLSSSRSRPSMAIAAERDRRRRGAMALGQHPLMGVLAGSVTLTGGPATGLAFAPLFERPGCPAAATLAVAAAMVGIVAGGLIGGPIGDLAASSGGKLAGTRAPGRVNAVAAHVVEDLLPEPRAAAPSRARTSRPTGC